MICAIGLEIFLMIKEGKEVIQFTISLLRDIALNVSLLQTWYPNCYVCVALNGVAWYLSASLFLYFAFPNILKFVKRKKQSELIIMSLILLIFEIIVCIPLVYVVGYKHSFYIWFMYCFPVFRLGDFFVGCVLGKILLSNQRKNYSQISMTIIEIIALAFASGVVVFQKLEFESIIFQVLVNWTTIYIPVAVIWIFLFINHRGLITRVLCNKLTIFIGDISPYAFLIHYVVTRYTKKWMEFSGILLTEEQNWIIILGELIFSILLSLLYSKIFEKVTSKE